MKKASEGWYTKQNREKVDIDKRTSYGRADRYDEACHIMTDSSGTVNESCQFYWTENKCDHTHLVQRESLKPVDMVCKFWVLSAELWHEESLLVLGYSTHHICINYTLHKNRPATDWHTGHDVLSWVGWHWRKEAVNSNPDQKLALLIQALVIFPCSLM